MIRGAEFREPNTDEGIKGFGGQVTYCRLTPDDRCGCCAESQAVCISSAREHRLAIPIAEDTTLKCIDIIDPCIFGDLTPSATIAHTVLVGIGRAMILKKLALLRRTGCTHLDIDCAQGEAIEEKRRICNPHMIGKPHQQRYKGRVILGAPPTGVIAENQHQHWRCGITDGMPAPGQIQQLEPREPDT